MASDHTYPDNFSIIFESQLSEESINDVGEFVDTLDELLIACVQSYTHLYNKTDKNYKDNLMKKKSWEEISTTCHRSVDEVQQRWKRLKDRYAKERRLNENAMRSGSAMQKTNQWPLFESMKFMGKHIQRKRTFTNVSLQSGTKSQNNTLEKLNLSHQNKRGSTSTLQLSHNIAQPIQELRTDQSTFPESSQMESQAQKRYPENQLERSERGLSRNWQNYQKLAEPIPKTFKSSTGVYQPSMSFTRSSTSNISAGSARSTSSTSTYENIDNFENTAISSDQASEISDYSRTNLSSNELDIPRSADEDVNVAKLSTVVTPSLPDIPTKCFSGGIQRKIRNKPDMLETSFVTTANVLKEYLLEKKGEKENNLPADEHLAKFIVSRLSQLPEGNRDEKRKKIIDVLLSK